MNRKSKAALIVAIAMIVVAALLIGSRLRTPGIDAVASAQTLELRDATCDSAQRACIAGGEDLEVEWQLGPPVRPMEGFAMRLRVLRGVLSADATITVDYQMRDMDMGQNRYRLERARDGVWQGQAMLAMCMSGRSDWIARLEIRDGGREWSAELPFTMTRR